MVVQAWTVMVEGIRVVARSLHSAIPRDSGVGTGTTPAGVAEITRILRS